MTLFLTALVTLLAYITAVFPHNVSLISFEFQNFKMLRQRNGLSLQSPLRPLSVLVFHLLLTHSVTGQSPLMGSSQPIVATVGDDIILPCHLEPAVDVAAMTLEWTRSDLDPEFVFVWRAGQDLVHTKHPSYKGRTSLFSDELKRGNISLKLSDVRPSDAGRYKCFIPDMRKGSFIELVVGAASSPVISLAGIDRDKGGVVLQCESAGWYPEPEVLWLDGEGKLLSAGPTETVRGPDDLYTVSSRVTVEKRHSNSFTCRVQQRNINQTTETYIYIPDDFFKVQSASAFPIITGLAVSLTVCIMFIVLLLFFLWKWRQNIIKTKRSHCDETETGKKKNSSKTNKTEDQSVPVEEREHLMTTETVEMKVVKGKGGKKSKHIKKQRCQQQLLEEQQRREEAEKGVQTLKEEMETKRKEVETKQSELQQLHEEKQRKEDKLQTLKEKLETKNKELETIKKTQSRFYSTSQIDEKQAEVQQLQNQIQRMESNLQTLMETLSKNMELERSRVTSAHSSSSASKWPIVSRQKFQEEQQRREDAENKVQILEEKLQTQTKKLESNKQAADKFRTTERDLTERQLKNKDTEISELKRDMQELFQRKQQEAKEAERVMKELTDKNTEWQKKLSDERTKREEAERQVEALKKELTTKPKTNESVPVQHGASSPTGPVIVLEVDPYGRYIRLKNRSNMEQQLRDWKLHVQVNKTIPITYQFDHPRRLQSGETVRIWSPGYRHHHTYSDLEWRELKSWSLTDQLQITLISNTGQTQHQLSL
ncbi:uncharacterized protein LOC117245887 isoform X4 [Epinephelus lanceolatus]